MLLNACALMVHVMSLLVFSAGVAQAEFAERDNYIKDIAVFADNSASMSIDAVQAQTFIPLSQWNIEGYTQAVRWFRLDIDPAPGAQELWLRIQPGTRNQLILYEPDSSQPSGWRTQITGNAVPWHKRSSFERDLVFRIKPDSPTRYYLSLRTDAAAWVDLKALTAQQFQREEFQGHLWMSFVLLLVASIVTWALHEYALVGDKTLLVFALAPGSFFLLVVVMRGYLAPLISSGASHANLVYALVVTTSTAVVLFHRLLISQLAVPRVVNLLMNALVVSELVVFVLVLTDHLALGMQLNNVNLLFVFPLGLLGAVFARTSPVPSKQVLVAIYGLLSVLAFAHIFLAMGLVVVPALSKNALLIHGALSAILFAYILHVRGRARMSENQATAMALGIADRERELQREKLLEQEKFTSLLAHELKNAAASIRLTLDALSGQETPQAAARHLRIGSAVHDIDALVERFVLSDAIEQGRVSPRMSQVDLAVVVQNVNVDAFDAQHFHVVNALSDATVLTDQHLLQVALSNLIEGAFQYAPQNSQVLLELKPSNARGVSIEISHEIGPAGVPDGQHAFKKYRSGDSAQSYRESGLGLYLVQQIALILGGHVALTVTSKTITYQLWIPENYSPS